MAASNLLWAHLLRKDATTTDPPSQIPPIAPQDKTGTSMRMLMHDTQANLEKFSTRLDGLLQRVDDCRSHVVNANKLLDVERDKVLSEMLEIAHRCQSEMKAHVGTPAQAPALDLVHVSQVSTERSVQALEKRIDALQTLLQTHAHTMQSIQDQQNALISAVLPLVPVLNGVSPQIDQIKAALSDMVVNAVSTMTNSVENVRSTLVSELARGHGHVGSSTRVTSSSKSMSSSRRKRSDKSAQEISFPLSSPLDTRVQGGPRLSFKRPRIEGGVGGDQLTRKSPRLTVPSTNSSDPLPLLQTPRTPRQPLADLFFLPQNKHTGLQHRAASYMDAVSNEYIDIPQAAISGPSTDVRSMSRPPLQPLESARPHLRDPSIARRCSPGLRDIPSVVDDSATAIPNVAGSLDRDALSKEIKIEEILEANVTDVISIHSSPLSSPPTSLPPGGRHDLDATGVQLSTQQRSRLRNSVFSAPEVEPFQIPPPSSDPSPPKSMSLRDRRAQMSRSGRPETRRFIPLAPWSDEE